MDRDFVNYLRAQRDDPAKQAKVLRIQNRDQTFFIRSENGEQQSIPATHTWKYPVVYICQNTHSIVTPKERAFMIKRQIQENLISINALQKAGHPFHEIHYYEKLNTHLANKLKKIVF